MTNPAADAVAALRAAFLAYMSSPTIRNHEVLLAAIPDATERAASDPWRECVLDACAVSHQPFFENDPKKTIDGMVEFHIQVALDPAVSERATIQPAPGMTEAQFIETVARIFDFKPHKQAEETRTKWVALYQATGAAIQPAGETVYLAKLAHYQPSEWCEITEDAIPYFTKTRTLYTAPPTPPEVTAEVYKRESTGEWVLELSGVIDDVAFTCRHTEPLSTAKSDVPGLPSHYSTPSAPVAECVNNEQGFQKITQNIPDGTQLYSRPIAPATDTTPSASEIDDMAFGYCPSGKIGELREFAYALLYRSAELAASQAPSVADDVMRDALRWRGFVGSARIKPQGSAGLNAPMPNHYAHMCLEIWTTYDRNYGPDLLNRMDYDNKVGREWLTKYADIAAAMLAVAPTPITGADK